MCLSRMQVFVTDEFMQSDAFSMFLKSWNWFKYHAIDNTVMREYIVINEERVWLNDQDNIWMYRPEYAHSVRDTKLSEEERRQQWKHYLDFWYETCLQNRYVYLKQVRYQAEMYDIGLFCKRASTLQDLSEKIDGYLEEISDVTFHNLVTLNHPSIYHVPAGTTQRERWFVFFGLLSCCNADENVQLYLSHRERTDAFEHHLMWRLIFNRNCLDNNIECV